MPTKRRRTARLVTNADKNCYAATLTALTPHETANGYKSADSVITYCDQWRIHKLSRGGDKQKKKKSSGLIVHLVHYNESKNIAQGGGGVVFTLLPSPRIRH